MNLSDQIIKVRESKGITQAEAARLLDMVQSNYARLEKRGSKLTLEQVENIAEALGASVNDLLGIEQAGQERIAELEVENLRLKGIIKDLKSIRSDFEHINKQLMLYDELFKERNQRSRELQEWAKDTIRSIEAGDSDSIDKVVRLIKELYL